MLNILRPLWEFETRRRLAPLLPLLLLFAAAILRFHALDVQSLWNDEGNSLRLAERAIPDLITAASRDIHPPGYYLALKAWISVTGTSEFALRALSALAGVLTVACVYALGKTLYAPGAGLIAGALVAANTFSIYYAQEARMYSFLALWASASMLLLARWMRTGSDNTSSNTRFAYGTALALINAAGLYTHYTYPAVILAQGFLFLIYFAVHSAQHRNMRELRDYVLINAVTLALFAPLLPTALTQIGGWQQVVAPADTQGGVEKAVRWLVYGITADRLPAWAYVWVVVFLIAALLPDWRGRWAAMPFVWLLTLIVPFFALNLFREANLKFLLPAQIALSLVIARGAWLLWELGTPNLFLFLEALPRLASGLGLLSLATFAGEIIPPLYSAPEYARPDYRTMARVASELTADDAIILNAPGQSEVFTYYYNGAAPVFGVPRGLGGNDEATRTETGTIAADARRIMVLYWGEGERDPNRVVESTLGSTTFEVSSSWYGDVRVVQYATLPANTGEPIRIDALFGSSIRLRDAALSGESFRRGEVLGVTLTWEALSTPDARYKVFIHIVGDSLATQRDAEPVNNRSLTTTWQRGDLITDTHGIPLNIPAGQYRVMLGLYDVNDPSRRLPVGDDLRGDSLEIGTITVE